MIDVKQAVAAAEKYALDALNASDLLLEEIQSDDDAFRITISFPNRRPNPALTGRPSMIGSRY